MYEYNWPGEDAKIARTRKSVYMRAYTILTLPQTIFLEANSRELLTRRAMSQVT